MTDTQTLEDLARECAERIWSIDNSGYLDGSRIGQYSNLILSTIRKAVEQERERCAKVAEDAAKQYEADATAPDVEKGSIYYAEKFDKNVAARDIAWTIRND